MNTNVFPNDGIFSGAYDDEDVGVEAGFNNMDNTIDVSPIPTLRVHKDHPKGQILGDPKSAVQTRGKIQKASSVQQALNPRRYHKLLRMKVRLKQCKRIALVQITEVRLVAQGFRQEEGIDYDEVFAPVARIEAIRLFLAFASFMGFPDYQMDVKSCFLYGTYKRRLYVHQTPALLNLAHPQSLLRRGQHLVLPGLVCAAQKYFTMEMMFGLGNKMLLGLENLVLPGKFGAAKQKFVLFVTVTTVVRFIMLSLVLALESIKDAQAAEISALKSRIKKLEKKCKPSISHHRAWLKSVNRLSIKKRFGKKESVNTIGGGKKVQTTTLDDSTVFDDQDADHGMEYMETEEAVDEGRQSGETEEVKLTDDTEVVEDKGQVDIDAARQEDSVVEPRTPPTTTSIFDDEDITMAQTLIKMKEEKAKEKGVSIKDVDDSSRPARSILTLKPLPTIDPKDKGKGVLKESPVKKVKRSDLDAAQIAKDAEIARLVHENELAEMEREREERQRQDQASMDYIASLYDEVQAKMDASEELAARLQMEEREMYTIEERSKLLAEFFERRKKLLAEERVVAKAAGTSDEEEVLTAKIEVKRKNKGKNIRKRTGHNFTMSIDIKNWLVPEANGFCKELASPKQTTLGKDISNPLIVGSLLKTIWLSVHHVYSMKLGLFQSKCQLIYTQTNLQEEPAPTGDQYGPSAPPVPKTVKQLAAKRNQERVKSILLLARPDEYLLKFHNVPDTKSLWEAIKSRFGGNEESKKMQKNVLKHQFENFTTTPNESLDKAYDRVYEDEMKRSSSSTSNSQNLAFLSSENTNRTNEVSTASGNFRVNTAGGTNSSTTSPPLDNEDLQQIDQDDLEELDIRWKVAMMTVRGTLLRNANQEGTKGKDLMVKMAGVMQQQMNHHHKHWWLKMVYEDMTGAMTLMIQSIML
ncbi:uncharacterized mitochondrial protein-like protein [Tanacetum coccineum]